jgi:lysophospholipase L1-like esterase
MATLKRYGFRALAAPGLSLVFSFVLGCSEGSAGSNDTGGASTTGSGGASAAAASGITTTGSGGASAATTSGAATGTGGQAASSATGSGGQGAGSGGEPGATGSGGSGGTGAPVGKPMRDGLLRIMPLGDSITETTCYRARLWEKLADAGLSDFDYVGSRVFVNCGNPSYDGDNEGHSGALVTDLVSATPPVDKEGLADLVAALAANPADLVLMHLGTNDVWNRRSSTAILDAYSVVVDELRNVNPNVWIIVAQIIPVAPDDMTCSGCACTECPALTETLNAAIPGWAAMKSLPESPILVVDQWTGFSAADDTTDRIHPNDSGAVKMADVWYAAVAPLF